MPAFFPGFKWFLRDKCPQVPSKNLGTKNQNLSQEGKSQIELA